MADYIKTIEKMAIPDGVGVVGLEHYLEASNPGALSAASKQLWVALLLLSLLVSAIGFWKA